MKSGRLIQLWLDFFCEITYGFVEGKSGQIKLLDGLQTPRLASKIIESYSGSIAVMTGAGFVALLFTPHNLWVSDIEVTLGTANSLDPLARRNTLGPLISEVPQGTILAPDLTHPISSNLFLDEEGTIVRFAFAEGLQELNLAKKRGLGDATIKRR